MRKVEQGFLALKQTTMYLFDTPVFTKETTDLPAIRFEEEFQEYILSGDNICSQLLHKGGGITKPIPFEHLKDKTLDDLLIIFYQTK